MEKVWPRKSRNFRLSTGSIFHTVTLQPDETITVTKYQAKRTQKIESFVSTYRYILEVPESHCYLPMEITLKNRMQLAFNWSYLDNLVSTHGIHESYELSPVIKFWRSRFLILPGFKETTRKLVEELREAKTTGKRVRCNIYDMPLSLSSYEKLCDRFVVFLESINRIRRINVPQRTRQFNWSEAMEQPRPRRDSLTAMSSATPITSSDPVSRSGLVSTPPVDRESESVVGPAATAIHSTSTTLVQQPPAPPLQLHSVASLSAASSSSYASSTSVMPLSTHSDMTKIVAALLDPDYGLSYMDGSIPLPKHTFCGYDLTNWLTRNLVDVVSLEVAMKYAQALLDAGYICHSSGNRAHKFLNGFFLYTLLAEISESPNNQNSTETPPTTTQISDRKSSSGDPIGLLKSADIRKTPFPTAYLPPGSTSPLGLFSTDFQKEWMEVLLVCNAPPPTNSSIASTFFLSSTTSRLLNPSAESDTTSPEDQKNHLASGILSSVRLNRVFGTSNSSEIHVGSDGVLRKRVTRDLRDSSNTSVATQALKEHPEWYCLLYDLNYHPTCAFGVEIQWLVASPSRLNEMLLHFLYYKATSHGFSIVPAPCYPFGYSGTRYSMYPLRAPIFVPCRIFDLIRARNGIPKGKSEPLPCEVVAELFPELPESEQMVALFYFQERILSRFGFIPLSYSPAVQQSPVTDGRGTLGCPPPYGDEPPRGMSYTQRMFVHISGGMFAMVPMYPHCPPKKQTRESLSQTHPVIPKDSLTLEGKEESREHVSKHMSPRRVSTNNNPPSSSSYATTLCSDNEAPGGGTQDANLDSIDSTVTTGTFEESSTRRSVLDRKSSCFEIQTEVGFFWMWNHMLPRRWRGQTTVEEVFDLGMLEDLRTFCSGGADLGIEDNRLLETLEEFRSTLCGVNKADTPK
nr:Pleckstrin G protein interacting region [Hymenolepis microstoma]